jgi:hypothetical protein
MAPLPRRQPLAVAPRVGSMCVGLIALISSARAEPFIGQFELKTLDAGAGEYEFQSQNAWAWDQPPRRIAVDEDGEAIGDENTVFKQRHALELEFGLSDRYKMRVGVEGERERLNDELGERYSSLKVEEFGIELIAILIPRTTADGLALGAVVELEGPLDQEESNSVSVGPILEYRFGEWFAAAVPMLVYSFGGEREPGEPRDTKWDFAYAAQLVREVSSRWSLSLEAYGTIERLGNSGHPSEAARLHGDFNQHRAGLVAYYSHPLGARDSDDANDGSEITIGVGLLRGLNGNTADHTLKFSLEIDF